MKCSWVKSSDVLSNRVPNIIRRYREHMQFAACMAVSLITFFRILLVPFLSFYTWSMFRMLLFNFVNYVLLLLLSLCILIVT